MSLGESAENDPLTKIIIIEIAMILTMYCFENSPEVMLLLHRPRKNPNKKPTNGIPTNPISYKLSPTKVKLNP